MRRGDTGREHSDRSIGPARVRTWAPSLALHKNNPIMDPGSQEDSHHICLQDLPNEVLAALRAVLMAETTNPSSLLWPAPQDLCSGSRVFLNNGDLHMLSWSYSSSDWPSFKETFARPLRRRHRSSSICIDCLSSSGGFWTLQWREMEVSWNQALKSVCALMCFHVNTHTHCRSWMTALHSNRVRV